jgi:hypothetical protein
MQQEKVIALGTLLLDQDGETLITSLKSLTANNFRGMIMEKI